MPGLDAALRSSGIRERWVGASGERVMASGRRAHLPAPFPPTAASVGCSLWVGFAHRGDAGWMLREAPAAPAVRSLAPLGRRSRGAPAPSREPRFKPGRCGRGRPGAASALGAAAGAPAPGAPREAPARPPPPLLARCRPPLSQPPSPGPCSFTPAEIPPQPRPPPPPAPARAGVAECRQNAAGGPRLEKGREGSSHWRTSTRCLLEDAPLQ